MKTRILMACVVLLSLIAAQPRLPAGASQAPPEPGAEYLLSLPVPTPSPDVPANLTPEGAAAYARRLTIQQAEPLLDRLQELREERTVVDFRVRPDLHGVIVQLAKSAQPHSLDSLPGVIAVMPANDAQTCAAGAAKALEQQVMGVSQAAALREYETRMAASAEATNPSITVYRSLSGSYGSVYGYTDASTSVTLTIYRANGTVRTTQTGTSASDGYYSFYPSWYSCPVSGYNWVPHVGDRVQVTAAGNTVSTTVVPISLWADPGTDTVAGVTAAGRTVEVWVYYPYTGLCSWQSAAQMTTSGLDGAFTASFAGSADFAGNASANAYVRDGNGNSTYSGTSAYSVRSQFNDEYFYGSLKPWVPFTATLTRGATLIDTVTGTSGADNYYYGYFSEPVQAGDLIEVTGDGAAASLTAAPLTDLVLDPATDSVSGITGPGRELLGYFYREDNYPSYNGCSGYSACAEATADGSGEFTLQSSFDWLPGDYVYFYLFDTAGNYQYHSSRYAPLIMASPGSSQVTGTWPENSTTISGTLSRGGSPIATDTDWVSSDVYYLYFYPYVEPGDVIEVTDGVTTASMTVMDVTAHVNSLTDLVYGQAPAQPALLQFYNYRRSSGSTYYYCRDLDMPGGSYSIDLGIDMSAKDSTSLYVQDSDGHKTRARGHAFWLSTPIGENYAYGYTTEPSTGVHVDLLDSVGASKGNAYDESSAYDGYYSAFFSPLIVPGDSLEVATDDGWNATVEVPELTAEQDEVNNRVYGQSPADQPVRASFRRHYNGGWWSYTFTTYADAAGNYSVPLDGYYWSRDCSPLQAGERCTSAAAYYNDSAGHEIERPGTYPPPAEADLFEGDDSFSSATLYEEVQSHTFHGYPDYDWVQFTVPPEDVANAIPYRFETFHLGWGMATQARLYASDGTTLIWDATAYEDQGAGLDYWWTPTSPGTYYLELSPPSSYYSAYCDALYDLRIFPLREQIFLPVVMRNNQP
jgi:hypothetical protein